MSTNAQTSREALRTRASLLKDQVIQFIPNADFRLTGGDSRKDVARIAALIEEDTAGSEKPEQVEISQLSGRRKALLTPEEEQILFRRMNLLKYRAAAKQGDVNPGRPSRSRVNAMDKLLTEAYAIRRRIVESNIGLVLSIARRLSSSPEQFEEFVSDGLMILLGAIDKFDFSRGFRFSTYATHSVQRHFYRQWKTSQRRKERFVMTDNHVLADVAQEAPDVTEPDGEAAQRCYQIIMASVGERLDEREQTILKSRFGLGDQSVKSLRELGAAMGLSKERVRQIQVAAVEKLRSLAIEKRLHLAAG